MSVALCLYRRSRNFTVISDACSTCFIKKAEDGEFDIVQLNASVHFLFVSDAREEYAKGFGRRSQQEQGRAQRRAPTVQTAVISTRNLKTFHEMQHG